VSDKIGLTKGDVYGIMIDRLRSVIDNNYIGDRKEPSARQWCVVYESIKHYMSLIHGMTNSAVWRDSDGKPLTATDLTNMCFCDEPQAVDLVVVAKKPIQWISLTLTVEGDDEEEEDSEVVERDSEAPAPTPGKEGS